MTASVQMPISPNYLSSDRFTPGQSGRRTIPSIGIATVERPPLGGKIWGTEITNYGGIGELPFQGKVKVKDLPVARSHRHFGSGIHTYKADLQPYDVTSLRLSECRKNDQLLPPVGTVTLDPRKCHVGPILQDVPYSTHIQRTEMFPRGPEDDTTRGKYGKNPFPLCRRTKDALSEYREKIYKTSTHGLTWGKEPCKGTCETACKLLEKRLPVGCLSPSIKTKTNEDGKHPKRVRFVDQEQSAKPLEIVRNKRRLPGLSPLWPPSVYLLEKTFQVKEDLERFPIKISNSSDQVHHAHEYQLPCKLEPDDLDGVTSKTQSSCFDPDISKENCGFPSRCPADVCRNTFCGDVCGDGEIDGATYDGTRPTSLCNRLATFEDWKQRISNFEVPIPPIATRWYPEEVAAFADEVVHKKDEEEEDVEDEEYKEQDDPPKVRHGNCPTGVYTAHLRLPRQPFPENPLFKGPEHRKVPLPPVPLSQCLRPTGDRVPCRLGLRFKTEAYKRFQAMHPDPVPDLRKPHNERKRYFFYGYHASVFRG